MRRWYVFWLAAGVAACVAAVFLDPTRIALSYLRGEPFYKGRPASYWGRVVKERLRFKSAFRSTMYCYEIRPFLRSMVQGDPAAIPVLLALRFDADLEVRAMAAWALGKMRSHPRRIIPVLAEMVKDECPTVRWYAVRALPAFGAEAEEAVPLLDGLLHDPDAEVRREAAEALKEIRGQ